MLFDFAFNWGIGEVSGFPATSVLRLVNAGDFAGVAHDLVHGRGPATTQYPGGRPYDKGLEGVRKRRIEEAAAFVDAAPPERQPMNPVDIIRRAMADLLLADVPKHFVPGWENRGRPYPFHPECVVCHHTATSARASGDYPSLGIVRDGRSDLPGPLSQFGLGRSGMIYVIAAGTANHAGPGGWRGVSGNTRAWGIEAENDGVGQPWSPGQLDAYPRLCAALARHTGFGPEMVCAHREWNPRDKIDPTGIDMGWLRSEVARLLVGTPKPLEDDFALLFAS